MSLVRVYLGGEGRNELGSRSGHPSYQDDSSPGVIETLLRRVESTGWEVAGAMDWRRIVKLQSRGHTPNEDRNVLGLVLETKRAGARVLAFVRDSDGNAERTEIINDAIVKSKEKFPEVEVIGGNTCAGRKGCQA